MASGYDHNEVEAKWAKDWEDRGTYRWDPERPRSESFIIDTPPPTVSGSLHVGHVFSYTQTDVIARYKRMRGLNVFYPIGWDDNGLPTERRVENYFSVRCNPNLPYDPDWKAERPEGKDAPVKAISRRNFIDACALLTIEDEKAFESLWRRIGLSFDWSLQYATISTQSIHISQYSFLDLVKKGELYSREAPFFWDTDDQTAVAQAEMEDREIQGAFYDLRFEVEGGGHFIISTTRPELLAACVAVVAHPDDERYRHLFGKTAITPLFHAPVPICAAEHADPEKGSGILMVCTFGDMMDVEWWKQSKQPIRLIVEKSGRLMNVEFGKAPFDSRNPEKANQAYDQISGLRIKQAQKKIAGLLAEEGSAADGESRALQGDPKPITHPVKFYERGKNPLEIVTTRQWFINVLDHTQELVEQGRKVEWHPSFMLTRYENWVEGLNQDWCISRQRFFGVPIPVWYPLDEKGAAQYDSPIYPAEDMLPVDPLSHVPPGYDASQRGQPGGFEGDGDVMDTWATSGLTPQLVSHWGIDSGRHKKLFPADMRPQAHEIIRTWAFATITKAWFHEKEIPWKHAVISGWILDPDRKKMSKSKGNVVTPQHLIEEHSADGVRYWAARARLGADTAFDPGMFKIGQKLVTKLFNACRFVLSHFERLGIDPKSIRTTDITQELDCALIAQLRCIIDDSTAAFERFDYAAALQLIEDAFWSFCDNYLELVKKRSYLEVDSTERKSAFATLGWSINIFLRMFAPYLPFVTEELWSGAFAGEGKLQSVHSSSWPSSEEISGVRAPSSPKSWAAIVDVIGKIRGAKTVAQKSLKWPVASVTIEGCEENCSALNGVLKDLSDGANAPADAIKVITDGNLAEGEGLFKVTVELAESA